MSVRIRFGAWPFRCHGLAGRAGCRSALEQSLDKSAQLSRGLTDPPRRDNRVGGSCKGLAIATTILIAGCSPHYTFRYKLTLNVEANGKTYSHSNVVQCSEYDPGKIIPGSPIQMKISGDANLIDLGDGRVIVALLDEVPSELKPAQIKGGWRGDIPDDLLLRVYGLPTTNWVDRSNSSLSELTKMRGPKEIGPAQLPAMVTFKDVKTPSSIILLDPTNLARDLGADVKLKSATIEVTREPITRGIQNQLPWLQTLGDGLDGSSIVDVQHPTVANSMSIALFTRK